MINVTLQQNQPKNRRTLTGGNRENGGPAELTLTVISRTLLPDWQR
jgi:hypothetical protein